MRSIFEKKIIISIAVFTLVAMVIVGAVIVPTVFRIQQLDRDTNDLRLYLEKKNEQATNFQLAVKQMTKIQAEMPPFADYLFYSGQELHIITTLESLASTDGMSQHINSSDIDSIVNQHLTLSITVTGPYDAAFKYLNDLEHLPYFVTVTKFSLSPFSDRSATTDKIQPQQVIMNLDLSLYVVP